MSRKPKIHYAWRPGVGAMFGACGYEYLMERRSTQLTRIKKNVNCKNCKRTKLFRKD